jgi:Flp pilus assembly protein TadD
LLLAEIFVQQNRYPDAIAVYERAIKADEKDFRPLLGKALVLKEQGKMTEADSLFKQAILLAPVQYKDQIKEIALETPEKPLLKPSEGSEVNNQN